MILYIYYQETRSCRPPGQHVRCTWEPWEHQVYGAQDRSTLRFLVAQRGVHSARNLCPPTVAHMQRGATSATDIGPPARHTSGCMGSAAQHTVWAQGAGNVWRAEQTSRPPVLLGLVSWEDPMPSCCFQVGAGHGGQHGIARDRLPVYPRGCSPWQGTDLQPARTSRVRRAAMDHESGLVTTCGVRFLSLFLFTLVSCLPD